MLADLSSKAEDLVLLITVAAGQIGERGGGRLVAAIVIADPR
jgi:hypothetical protein